MSGSISFSNIPPNARVPLFYVQFDSSMAGANQPTYRTLLLGQTLLTQPQAPVYVPSTQIAISLFGAGSQLARMFAAYVANDLITEVYAMPLPDAAGGTAASGAITFTGPATAAGTQSLMCAGQEVPVAVAVGDTATAQGANAAAAINAMPNLPMTATAAAGVVTLTARHKGVAAGQLDVRVNYYGTRGGEVTPAGTTVTITPFSGGSTDPDLSGVANTLGDLPFDYIALGGYTGGAQLASMAALMSDQSGRWSPIEQLYGHVFTAMQDTPTNLLAYAPSNNNQHLSVAATFDSPTPSFEWSPAWTGAIAPALQADPARPVQTLPISGVLAPPPTSRFTKTTQQALLTAGLALPVFDAAGNATVLRCPTTYQTNAYGQPDQSYYDVETLYTLMAITRQLAAAITSKFGRSKLADDGTPFGPGQPVVTPKIIYGEIVAQYQQMMRDGLVENAAAMAAATTVVRNSADPSRVDILFAPYLVSGLRIAAALNQFRLSAA